MIVETFQLSFRVFVCHEQGNYLYVSMYLLIKLIQVIFCIIFIFHGVKGKFYHYFPYFRVYYIF